MACVNSCTFIGNLGKDPEVRYMPNGEAVVNFSLGCTDQWKDKNGAKQEKTEWVRAVFFGKLAEICGEYLKKGSQVYVQGRMQTREYEKNGDKRYVTEIVGNAMVMLGSKPRGDQTTGGENAPAPAAPYEPGSFDDEPF